MFSDECAIASIGKASANIKTSCGVDPFDAVKFAADLNPFSDAGLGELVDCINRSDRP